ITSLTIPSGVTTIGSSAFRNMTSLTTVNFNATNCTTMGTSNWPVFQGCVAFTTLNIGNNVTRTPAHAFRSCTNLQHIYANPITPPIAVNSSTFEGINKNTCILHVPTGTQGAYSTADGWKEFFNILEEAMHLINGQVTVGGNPLANVTIASTGGASATTNISGAYSISVINGATVTLTPSLSGYTFTPPSITCDNVTNNINNQNFTAQAVFVPVTNITGVPTAATAFSPLTLTGTVAPSNATNQTITWSIQDAGGTGATITANVLNTLNVGTVAIRATIVNGASPTTPYTQDFNITVSKAVLGGTVTVSGSAVFGQSLTVVTTGLTSIPSVTLGTLTYQWRRGTTNISGATNSTYSLVQADIGSVINVVVTAANCSGSVTSPNTASVAKAPNTTLPPTPTKLSSTSTSITLHTVSGCEYNINGGAYQSSPIFGGLTPSTAYTFTQRYAETATHLASPASSSATFSTEAGTPPVLSGTVAITGSAVFGQNLTAIPNLTSTPPGDLGALTYQWKRSDVPIGSNVPNYTLTQEDIGSTITVTVTAANCTGSVTSNPTAVVTKATQTAPAAPILSGKTPTSITLTIVSGCEYNINGGAWQASPTFAGLTPNTSYAFTQRRAETATHFASPASLPAHFTTDNTTVPLYTIVSYVNNPAWGTITPYGENNVEEGGSIEFTITPYADYIIEDVLVNGVSYGAIETYTFNNVQENGAIAVVFAADVSIGTITNYQLRVYPNPTSGELRVTSYELQVTDIAIFDIYGRKLLSHKSPMSPETTINIAHFPTGVYFVKIATETGQVVRKVVKE
ncbi:MAG: leucine-rich repeat protein, partial [Bacteroidetes bacterium]|nr:leucine-rich repeat protein [Bacteroidota bacterium]MCL2302583.1 leucine-rich repeat protein [Lentimicrobiaceae bacterium]